MLHHLQWLFKSPPPDEPAQDYISSLTRASIIQAGLIAIVGLGTLALTILSHASPALGVAGVVGVLAGVSLAQLQARIHRSTDQALTAAQDTAKALGETAQAAAVSSDYLNTVLMSMAGSLVVLGPDNIISTVNQATLDMTGYEAHELVGKPLATLLDGELFNDSSDTIRRGGFSRQGERIYKTRDGDSIPVSFSSAIMRDRSKRVLGIVCVAQDISAPKKLETQLNERITQLGILQQVDEELTHDLSMISVLTLGLDMTMRLSLAEAGAISLMQDGQLTPVKTIGYPHTVSEADCVNNGIVARVVERQEAEFVTDVQADREYAAVLRSTRAMIVIPLVSQDRLIGVLHLETARAERFNPEIFAFLQLICARIAAVTDNARLYDTVRRQLDELQDLYAQVKTLEQLKTDMIRIAAHDLRNPLNNISVATWILLLSLGDEPSGDQRECIDQIENAVQRMQNITTDILSLERIAKVATGELSPVINLHDVVQQAYEAHRAEARNKNQQYTLSAPGQPLFVHGEPAELQEAAANFISNAIKYTPEYGQVTVTLNQAPDHAVFEVKDTGFGIPEDAQAHLFQPFFRARTQETQEIEGTGLGLHLVKNIIERHKGQIRFQSQRAQGSTFGFELPLVKTVGVGQSAGQSLS